MHKLVNCVCMYELACFGLIDCIGATCANGRMETIDIRIYVCMYVCMYMLTLECFVPIIKRTYVRTNTRTGYAYVCICMQSWKCGGMPSYVCSSTLVYISRAHVRSEQASEPSNKFAIPPPGKDICLYEHLDTTEHCGFKKKCSLIALYDGQVGEVWAVWAILCIKHYACPDFKTTFTIPQLCITGTLNALRTMLVVAHLHDNGKGGDPGSARRNGLGPRVLVVACASGEANLAHSEVAVARDNCCNGGKHHLWSDAKIRTSAETFLPCSCTYGLWSCSPFFASEQEVSHIHSPAARNGTASSQELWHLSGLYMAPQSRVREDRCMCVDSHRRRKVRAIVGESSDTAGQG
jgi:hypothetical protein